MLNFYVIAQGDKWLVRSDVEEFDQYQDPVHAIDAAIDLAEGKGKSGCHARVLTEMKNGAFQTVWTYGKDPYPTSPGRPANTHVHGTYRIP